MGEFSKFVLDYIKREGMSRRELALKMGVQHRTLNKYLNSDDVPTLHVLTALSRATNINLVLLLKLIAPDEVRDFDLDVLKLAEQISQLPPVFREAIVSMIHGLLADQQRTKNR